MSVYITVRFANSTEDEIVSLRVDSNLTGAQLRALIDEKLKAMEVRPFLAWYIHVKVGRKLKFIDITDDDEAETLADLGIENDDVIFLEREGDERSERTPNFGEHFHSAARELEQAAAHFYRLFQRERWHSQKPFCG